MEYFHLKSTTRLHKPEVIRRHNKLVDKVNSLEGDVKALVERNTDLSQALGHATAEVGRKNRECQDMAEKIAGLQMELDDLVGGKPSVPVVILLMAVGAAFGAVMGMVV